MLRRYLKSYLNLVAVTLITCVWIGVLVTIWQLGYPNMAIIAICLSPIFLGGAFMAWKEIMIRMEKD